MKKNFGIILILMCSALLLCGCKALGDIAGDILDVSVKGTVDGRIQGSDPISIPIINDVNSSPKVVIVEEPKTEIDMYPSVDPADLAPTPTPEPNTIIVLDPGHGGRFAGAVNGDFVERDLNLKLANYVRNYLLEHFTGVTVYLTREEDVSLSSDSIEDLALRADFAKDKNADVLISIHFNASDAHTAHGATVYITRDAELKPASERLGKSILKQLVSLGLRDRGVQTKNSADHFDEDGNPLDYYGVNRRCTERRLMGLIIEHCFMDSEEDYEFYSSEEGLKELAEADAVGIANYYNLRINLN